MKLFARTIGAMLIVMLALSLSTAYAAPDRQQPGQLLPDQLQSGELTDAVSEQTWTFEGSAGDLIVINMVADETDNLDPYLTLLDPNGAELTTNDDGGAGLNSRIGPYSLPDTGSYSVVAGKLSGAGGYTLGLSQFDSLATITVDEPGTGVLSAEHPVDYFLLPEVETEAMFMLLAPFDSDHIPPVFEVYGPNGQIASSEYLNNPLIDPIVLLPGNTYTVIATWDGSRASAPYELRLEPSRVELLAPGVTQTQQLNDGNSYNFAHYFQGDAGQHVRLTLVTEDLRSVSFDIASIDGSAYPFNANGPATRSITVEIELLVTGTYKINVYDGSYSYTPGSYSITLESAGTRTLDK